MSELFDMIKPFANVEELVSCVEEGLRGSVPEPWRVSRRDGDLIAWVIEPVKSESETWDAVEYSLFATADLRYLVLTYGNTDAGPIDETHFVHNAKLIDAYGAKRFGLARYLEDIFESCEPNQMGLT